MSLGSVMLVEGPAAGEASVRKLLGGTDYRLVVVNSVAEAITEAGNALPGVVVFDAGTLLQSGGCRTLHQEYTELPIIHIAPTGVAPKPDNGASVYLTRPLSRRRLLNRVQRLFPAGERKMAILQAGEVTLDLERRIVTVPGVGENLMTPRQAELLARFLRQPDEVITRKQLMKDVWKTEYVGDTRTLDVHVRWVREKIEENPSKPQRLVTRRGEGYIFKTGKQK